MANENNTKIVISAEDRASPALKQVSGHVLSLGDAAGMIQAKMAALGGALSVAGFAALISETVQAAGRLNDLAMQTGATVEALSELSSVGKLSDTGLDRIGDGLQKLTKNMQAARGGSKDQVATFEALGVSVTDAAGRLRDSGDVFKDVAKSIDGLANPTERVAAAQAVFGKTGGALVPMLHDLAVAGDLVVKTTTEQAALADNIGDNWTRLQTVYSGVGKTIALETLPALNDFVDAMLETAKASNGIKSAATELAADGTLKDWADNAAMAIAYVGDVAQLTANRVTLVGKAIGAAAALTTADGDAGRKAIVEAFARDARELLDPKRFSERLAERMQDPWRGWNEKNKEYAQRAAEVAKAYAAYPLEVQRQAMESLAKNTYDPVGGKFTPKGDKSDSEKAYDNLLKSVRDRIAVQELEAAATEKLTETQKLAAKFVADLVSGELKLSQAQKATATEMINKLGALEKANDLREKERKADEDWAKELDKANDAIGRQIAALSEKARSVEDEVAAYGLGKAALEDLTIARLEEQRAIADGFDGQEGLVANLDKEIAARKRLRDAVRALEVKDEAKKAAEESARAWQKFSDDIERSLTDALMRSFEAGNGFGKSFVDTLRNTLKTAALKVVVQAIVDPVMGGVRSLGNGGVVDSLANGASIYNAGSSILNNGVGSLGLGAAQSAFNTAAYSTFGGMGSQQAAMLAMQDAAFGMEGAAATLEAAGAGFASSVTAAIPYIGIGLAALSVVDGIFGKKGGPKTEGNSYYDPIANRQLSPGAFGDEGRDQGGGKINSDKLAETLGESIQASITRLGGDASGYVARLFYNQDPMGDAPSNIYAGVRKDGRNVFDRGADFGRSQEEFQAGIAEQTNRALVAALRDADLSDWADAIVEAIDPATASAQQLAEALAKLDGMAKVVPLFESLGIGAEKVSESLVSALGGFDATAAALESYYQNFYSEAEKQQRLADQVGKVFESLGVTEPATREGFRALVDSLDLTTAAGQRTYAGLMKVSGAFAQLTESAEQASKDAAQAAQRVAEESAKATAQAAATAARGALDALDRALGAEAKRIQIAATLRVADLETQRDVQLDSIDAAIEGYRQQAEAARDLEREVGDVFRTLADAAAEMGAGLTVDQGAARLSTMLDQARVTGALPEKDQLAAAIGAVRQIKAEDYASRSDYQLARARIGADLQSLADIAGAQTRSAADTAASLEDLIVAQEDARKASERGWRDQIRAVETAADDQLAALNRLRDTAHDQLDALNGNATAIQSVAEAIAGFNSSIISLAQSLGKPVPSAVAAPAVTRTSPGGGSYDVATDTWRNVAGGTATSDALRNELAKSVAAVGADATALQLYSAAKDGGFSLADVDQLLGFQPGTSEDWAKKKGLPSFAIGTNYVPDDMLAQIHKGERIVPAADNAALIRRLDSTDMAAEIAALRVEVAKLRAENQAGQGAIAFYARNTNTMLDSVIRGDNTVRTEVVV